MEVIKPFFSNQNFLTVEQHIILAEYISPGFHVSLLTQISLYIFLHVYVYISGHFYIWWESSFSYSLRLGEGHQVKRFIRKIGGGSGNYQVITQGRSRGTTKKKGVQTQNIAHALHLFIP